MSVLGKRPVTLEKHGALVRVRERYGELSPAAARSVPCAACSVNQSAALVYPPSRPHAGSSPCQRVTAAIPGPVVQAAPYPDHRASGARRICRGDAPRFCHQSASSEPHVELESADEGLV